VACARRRPVRIVAVEGAQVCDLNLWNLNNHRAVLGRTNAPAVQGAHVTTFDRSGHACVPGPMVTITNDTLPTEPTASGGRCR